MVLRATVTIDEAKIRDNAERVHAMLPGIEIIGVTKVTCGDARVARAMLQGGCVGIGESRLENIERLRGAGIDTRFWLIRSPVPGLAQETVRLVDTSLISEAVIATALSEAAVAAGRVHDIIAMIDVGDLREGMLPDSLPEFLVHVVGLPGVRLAGLGTSLTCYGGIVPSAENLGELVELARDASIRLGRDLIVSGGMSSSIELGAAGQMPRDITNLRIGESILLGVSTVTRHPLPGLHTDAFVLSAPVIECELKPSSPIGVAAQDAFGGVPSFEDLGMRRRAILAIGRQDVDPAGIRPLDAGVRVLGASSDHLVLDVHDMEKTPEPGDTLRFVPNYSATLRLFSSAYVTKEYATDRSGE